MRRRLFTFSRVHDFTSGYTHGRHRDLPALAVDHASWPSRLSVTKVMQREREEELIFRGKQYALAFLDFQKRQGRFPLELKELMQTQPRSARKLFKDPMCDCDDWGSSTSASPGRPRSSIRPTRQPERRTRPRPTPGTSPVDGDRQRRGSRPRLSLLPTRSLPRPANVPDQRNRGRIRLFERCGVPEHRAGDVRTRRSSACTRRSTRRALRTFKGEEYYDQWGFIAGQNNDDLPPADRLPGTRQRAQVRRPD